MAFDLQNKIDWVNQAWESLKLSLGKESKEKATLLSEELFLGFQYIIHEVNRLQPEALKEFYDWIINHEELSQILLQLNPEKIFLGPWEVINQLQQLIPKKFVDYFFCGAQSWFYEQEYLRADRAFRLLTILFPQNPDYWEWLSFCQLIRQLPELALVSLTFSDSLKPENPVVDFCMALCWIKLKEQEKGEKYLKLCLKHCGDNPTFAELKSKCEPLSQSNALTETILQELIQLFNMPMSPKMRMSYLYKTKKIDEFYAIRALPFLTLFETKIKSLEAAFNKIKEGPSQKINILGYFESKTLTITEKKRLKIHLKMFVDENAKVSCFFFGALIASMSVTSFNKQIRDFIAFDNPVRLVFSLSTSIEQQDSTVKGIKKYLYFYSPQGDAVVNKLQINREYGSTSYSYQESNREDNNIRSSHFLPKDIVGKSLLDFGCNQGGILFACRNLGALEITGMDLNPWCIEQANKIVKEQKIPNANFYVGDMENRAFLSTLPQVDTVFLLAILDTSLFSNKSAVIANVSRFAKHTLYYEGHVTLESHVPRMYEFLIFTDFTRFEYLGRFEGRVLIRCSHELINASKLSAHATTSDDDEKTLLNAEEIYLFTDSPKNPTFGRNCKLIQFVTRH